MSKKEVANDDFLEGGVTFYQNPFYDRLFVMMTDFRIPAKNRKQKEISKQNITLIEKEVTEVTKEFPELPYPINQKLFIVLSITGDENYLRNVDVDNLAKTILDTFKGKVYKDDKQVYVLYVAKDVSTSHGIICGVKKINLTTEIAKFIPALFSEKLSDFHPAHPDL